MSFSDFGRPVVEVSSSFEKSSSSPQGVQRLNKKLPPTLRHFQRRDNNNTNTSNSQRKEESVSNNNNKFTPSRGVRPRLETRNPVTNERLLEMSPTDDVVSVASSTVTNDLLDDSKDVMPPPVTPSPQKRPSSDSLFAGLHKEIVNFQVRIVYIV